MIHLLSFFLIAAQAKPLCDNCNVVLIALDALQAKHVHHLGHKVQTTKNLDALAKDGFSFRQAISPASWTVPTYLSVFSGTYPSVHGLTNRYVTFTKEKQEVANFQKRNPNLTTMAQTFKDAGYRTGGFTGDAGVSAVLGYDKGFEVYTDETQFGGIENSAGKALAWLDKVKDQKFFMFVHGYDSHGQFSLAPGYKGRFYDAKLKTRFTGTREEQAQLREKGLKGEALNLTSDEIKFWRNWYDGKIADADERLGHLIGELKKRNLLEKTVVIVFSDHGTEFYEHGRFDHGYSLYDELLHVPLVLAIPGQKGGKVVSAQVGTQSILPTTLEITGIGLSEALKKQVPVPSLVPLIKGDGKGYDVFSETDYRNFSHKRAVRTKEGWKYIVTLENGKEELFQVSKDPTESRNLASVNKAKLAQLKKQLNKHMEGLPAPVGGLATGCLPAYQGQCDYQPYDKR